MYSMLAATAETSQSSRAVEPEPSLFEHTQSREVNEGSGQTLGL